MSGRAGPALRRFVSGVPPHGDEGSATVLVLGFAMALVLLVTALAAGVALAGAGQRARTAADLAALAVADLAGQAGTGTADTGVPGSWGPDACLRGEQVAAANGARLVACHDEATSRVEVAVRLPWGGEVHRVAVAVPGA